MAVWIGTPGDGDLDMNGGTLTAGGLTVSAASDPILRVTDTTTPCTAQIQALDSSVIIGSETNHNVSLVAGDLEVARLVYTASADRYATLTPGVSGSGTIAAIGSSGANFAIKPGGTISAEFGGTNGDGRGFTFIGTDSSGNPKMGSTGGHIEIDPASTNTVIITGLPTSASGLPTGALWNNTGVLNVA